MSAFFVGTDHINAMLTFVERMDTCTPMPDGTRVNRPTNSDLTKIGQALIHENIASLAFRYPNDYEELVDVSEAKRWNYQPDLNWWIKPNTALRVIKLCHCYDYQSCEHDGWEQSFAYKFSHWLADRATSRLPGYDDADWGYYKNPDEAEIHAI